MPAHETQIFDISVFADFRRELYRTLYARRFSKRRIHWLHLAYEVGCGNLTADPHWTARSFCLRRRGRRRRSHATNDTTDNTTGDTARFTRPTNHADARIR